MYRTDDDAIDSQTDFHRWKSSRRFQTYRDDGTEGYAHPASWAGDKVRAWGCTRALETAKAQRDLHPEGSVARAFYATAAELLQAGIVQAGGAA